MHYSKMYGSSSSVHPVSVSRTRGASVDCPLTRQGQIGQGSIFDLAPEPSAANGADAALKAVPLGQTAGQRVLTRLASEMPAAVAAAIATTPERRQLFAPMLSILAARHETQYSRLFRS